ncbi:DDE domain-containing protein [Mesorhizobium albiziae]|uniref:DDE domain-containing protein n=1 Tax=Neomesorhizobium albiziae TaxID=335020 RepID=A0A1I4EKG4_9HYPH|nr:hypothetical protein GCM10007937_37420 [Mesorhizobium albiziae]SFL05047.1 DDE domain-containing protein [Mesorhizobium albiziae]
MAVAAVDQDGFVLDVLGQSRRNAKAAKRLMKKLLKKQGHAPRVMVTDKLGSYAVAGQGLMPHVEHRRHKGLNYPAENSHQLIRRRPEIMKRVKSPGQLQRFASIHSPLANCSRPRQALSSADQRDLRNIALAKWRQIAHVAATAGIRDPIGHQHARRDDFTIVVSFNAIRDASCRVRDTGLLANLLLSSG